jgi:hypothetical protein
MLVSKYRSGIVRFIITRKKASSNGPRHKG